MSPIRVLKSTGESEIFDPNKLASSLHKAGASNEQVDQIVAHISGEIINDITTADIYRHAFDLLRSSPRPQAAAHYSMKRAVADLGPKGFPFEKFVAEIFKSKGYEAITDQVVYGHCVPHEVDVVAWKDDELVMIEAKFHNEYGLKSDLKTALYIKARYDDLKDGLYEFGGKKRPLTTWHLFTNTKFTDTAIHYAECNNLSLVGWNYPQKGNLEDLIESSGLHPLTSLTTLTTAEKNAFLDKGFVLARHIIEEKDRLTEYGIPKEKMSAVIQEAEYLSKA